MNKNLFFFLIMILVAPYGFSQEINHDTPSEKNPFQSIRPNKKKKDTLNLTSDNYKIISVKHDTTAIDTSLTIKKYFQHNIVREDLFGKISLYNEGQPFNQLTYNKHNNHSISTLGARAKDFLYVAPENVHYYHTPTPITQIMYKNAIEQGDIIDVLFSANFTPELNAFIAYKGLSSLGNYQNSSSKIGNFKTGISFSSADKRYRAMMHYVSLSVNHQENGGISNPEQFESGNNQYLNRGVIDVFLTDASTEKISERYFLNHQYLLFKIGNFSDEKGITVKHQFYLENQLFKFLQNSSSNSYLGASYVSQNILDKASLNHIYNEIGVQLNLPYIGSTYLFGKLQHYNYNLYTLFYSNGVLQPNKIKNNDWITGFSWKKHTKKFQIETQAQYALAGKMNENFISANLSYSIRKGIVVQSGVLLNSYMPTFMQTLYTSDYTSYNWNHLNDFDRIYTQNAFAKIKTPWIDISAEIHNIKNYTYFQSEIQEKQNTITVNQHKENIPYAKVQLHQSYSIGKFTIDNSLILQRVTQNTPVLNLPSYVGRHTLYFSTHLFNKAMFMQTGISVHYFSSYYANRYNPVISEFTNQTQTKIGNYPLMDYFVNAKVKTMRIFISAEHFNALFSKYNYYSAPEQPYRDFSIRFGVVWNFFS